MTQERINNLQKILDSGDYNKLLEEMSEVKYPECNLPKDRRDEICDNLIADANYYYSLSNREKEEIKTDAIAMQILANQNVKFLSIASEKLLSDPEFALDCIVMDRDALSYFKAPALANDFFYYAAKQHYKNHLNNLTNNIEQIDVHKLDKKYLNKVKIIYNEVKNRKVTFEQFVSDRLCDEIKTYHNNFINEIDNKHDFSKKFLAKREKTIDSINKKSGLEGRV